MKLNKSFRTPWHISLPGFVAETPRCAVCIMHCHCQLLIIFSSLSTLKYPMDMFPKENRSGLSLQPPPCKVLQLHVASVPGWMDRRSCVQRSNGSNDSNSRDVMALTVIRLQNISSRRGNGSISLAINTETAAAASSSSLHQDHQWQMSTGLCQLVTIISDTTMPWSLTPF